MKFTAFRDLICPNDLCPGGFGPAAGPWRRHRWTANGTRYHNQGIYADSELVCSECNTPGVEPGAVTEFLPTTEEAAMPDTTTHILHFGEHVKVTLEWPATIDLDPSVSIDLHHYARQDVDPTKVVEALGGPRAFDAVDSNYLTITATEEGHPMGEGLEAELTYYPPSAKSPTNPTALAVRTAQEGDAGDA